MYLTVLPWWKSSKAHLVLSYVYNTAIPLPTYEKFINQLAPLTNMQKEISYLSALSIKQQIYTSNYNSTMLFHKV
jgi:hypothetical protein